MAEVKRILIIRLGAIGDVVRTLPSLHLIRKRFPDAWIAWAVEEKSSEILEGHPDLDELIIVPRKKWTPRLRNPLTFPSGISEIRRFLKEVREKRFDAVLDFHSSVKSGIISLASSARERVGYSARYARELNFLFNTIRIPLRGKRISRMERNLALLKHLGIDQEDRAEIEARIAISRKDTIYIDDHLKSERLEGKKKAIIFPGASARQAYKKWGSDNYVTLLTMLLNKTEYIPILAWGPGEQDECREIAKIVNASFDSTRSTKAGSEDEAMNEVQKAHVSPPTTLKQLAELIRRCDIFIGGDTGAMHISCAMGTPCLVIYGPTDPVINAPWGRKFRVVYDEVDCAPCRKRRCKKRKCFEKLTPDVVYNKLEHFIEELS